ncbi:MAG: type IV secretory system conjugative DNA transfer family protein [Lachnospiraceae bacterium]|nr:type IV secretory system conjugative DNA transfer family protein [Lachnospiraceae bacterium]
MEARGFEVHVLDFVNPEKSETFNPLDSIRRKKERYRDMEGMLNIQETYNKADLRRLVNIMLPDNAERDKFWVKTPRQILISCIALVLETFPKKEQHMGSVVKVYHDLLVQAEIFRLRYREGKGDAIIPLFDDNPNLDITSFAYEAYKGWRGSIIPENTWGCLVGFTGNALEAFTVPEYRRLFNKPGSFELAELGRRKIVLFLNVSDTDRCMDSMINTFYTTVLQKLCEEADSQPDGRLKVPVRIMMDDFASNVFIEDFDKIISVIRSREIYVSVILQNIAQLEGMYGQARACSIAENCDSTLFFGGSDPRTMTYLASRMNRSPSCLQKLSNSKLILLTRGKDYKVLEKIKYWTMDLEEFATLDKGAEA